MDVKPNFFKRLLYSLLIFLRFLFDGVFAGRVLEVLQGAGTLLPPTEGQPLPPTPTEAPTPATAPRPAPAPTPEAAPAPALRKTAPAVLERDEAVSALHLLSLLQREGRLVDFLQEDVSSYGDADVGAAARVVHEGCRKVLADYFVLEPVRAQSEGDRVVLEKGFDPSTVRLTGNVSGEPPFSGILRHHGWKAAEVKLPAVPTNHDPAVVAPAEVEL